MFIADLFIIAKNRYQPRDPSMSEHIPWNSIHSKKEQTINIGNHLDEFPRVLLNEKRKSQKFTSV